MLPRRQFIRLSAATSVAITCNPVFSREPFQRSGKPRFQVGLAAYSLRSYFEFMKGKPNTRRSEDGPPMDMIKFIDYCADNDFDAAELTSYFFKPDADADYYRNLKQHAFIRGVTISGTAIGNNFTVGKGPKLDSEIAKAIKWIDNAAILGAPHIRFFAGTKSQLAKAPERLAEAAEAVNHCAKHAAKHGVFLGIENHGQLSADQMIQIMDKIESSWVGINLDTGNFVSDDPYGDLERCIGYAVNIQVKVSMKNSAGEKYEADLKRVGKILKDGGYQGFVILEYEDEDPYKNIPIAHRELREVLGD